MDTRPLTSDILVLREQHERSVLVRGQHYTTAIDIPTDRTGVAEVVSESRRLTHGGLRMAILTREPEGTDLPLSSIAGARVVRADRNPGAEWHWDMVPRELLRVPEVPVHLVRESKTIYDDAGRAFHCEPCPGAGRSLAVRIEPEDVLVVCDDLHPDLPPQVEPGAVAATIERFQEWRDQAPHVLVPASGIPIAGERVADVLESGISYLVSLQERVRTQILKARFPWERLVHTISWCDHWRAPGVSRPLLERHRQNIRGMAEDVWLTLDPDASGPLLATA